METEPTSTEGREEGADKEGPFFNTWVEPRDAVNPEPSARVEVGSIYNFALDFSAAAYEASAAVLDSFPASTEIKEEIAKLDAESAPRLRVYVVPILEGSGLELPGGRLSAERWNGLAWSEIPSDGMVRMDLDLAQLRAVESQGVPGRRPGEPFGDFGARARVGGIRFAVRGREPGCAAVALSIWREDLSMPLDHLIVPVPVGSARCEDPRLSRQARSGFVSLLWHPVGQDFDAALHVFDLPSDHSVAVYVPRHPGTCSHYVWDTPSSFPEAFTEPSFQHGLATARQGQSADDYPALGSYIYRRLFPGHDEEGPCGGFEAAEDLKRLSQEEGRALFVRVVRAGGRPVLVPLELLFLKRQRREPDSPRTFPHRLQVVQPLFRESYDPELACLVDYAFVLPQSLDKFGPVDLGDLAERIRQRRGREPIRDLESFRRFMDDDPDPAPQGGSLLVLLGHHGAGDIYFDDAHDSWTFSELRSSFHRGSAVMLDACATGDLAARNLDLVQALNKSNFDAVLLSPFDVPTAFGVSFAKHLAAEAASSDGSLSQIIERAKEATIREKAEEDPTRKTQWEGIASQFVFAGNGSLHACPREGNAP